MTERAKQRSHALERRTAEHPPVEPDAWAPTYVHACHERRWSLQLRAKAGVARGMRLTFLCNSRHHRGPCRDTWSRRLRGRLLAPESRMRTAPLRDVAFWTLTLDRRVRAGGRLEANRELGGLWRKLYTRLSDWARRNELARPEFFWIREAHRDGFPHLHLVVVQPQLAEMLRVRDAELVGHDEVKGSDRAIAPDWMRSMAKDCGFGERFDASLARDAEAIAGYAAKVTRAIDDVEVADAIAGEMTKQSQIPERLPPHARHYGASRGFMPARRSSGEWTGWLEDEYGRTMGVQPKSIEDAERRVIQFEERGEVPVRIYDASNVLAVWEDVSEARAFAEGDSLGTSVVSRSYVIRREREKYKPNAAAVEERVLQLVLAGLPWDSPPPKVNRAEVEARRLKAIALVRRKKAANDDGFENAPWAW